MIVEMRKGATQKEINVVTQRAKSLGFGFQLNQGTDKTVVAILGGHTGKTPTDVFAVLPGVESVTRIMKPYKLSSREFQSQNSVVNVDGVEIGANKPIVVMAGPCAVESAAQLKKSAEIVKSAGAKILRGGAYKPRTSPFSFQGLQEKGLELLAKVSREYSMPVVSEVTDTQEINAMATCCNILQIGSRNMQNFVLLSAVGKAKRPVVLKRGFSCTVTEWLTAADYILNEETPMILCERGIRTFEDSTRFSLDISSIPVIKRVSHLPVIVDPSHAAGHYALVPALAKAAVAAGADGLLIEVHPNPKEALVDGLQSLTPSDFARLMKELKAIAESVGRSL